MQQKGNNLSTVTVPTHLLIEGKSFAQTYQPVLDFHGWKVAMLRHFDVVAPDKFYRIERHWNTNEVFVLTAGQTDLIIFEGDPAADAPTDQFYVIPMEFNVAYDVQQSVWHHCVMSSDAHIIIFERSETSVDTTNYHELSPELVRAVRQQFTAKT